VTVLRSPFGRVTVLVEARVYSDLAVVSKVVRTRGVEVRDSSEPDMLPDAVEGSEFDVSEDGESEVSDGSEVGSAAVGS